MKDHDTRGYVAPTNACDLAHLSGNGMSGRMPIYFKLTETQMERPNGCQSDTVLVLNSRHGLPSGAILFGRA